MDNNTVPSNDERLLALLAHLSVLFGGIILPIVIWAVQKDKSQFVRFHSLQAVFYHVAYIALLVIFIFALVFFVLAFGAGFGVLSAGHHSDPGAFPVFIILMTSIFYLGIFIVVFAFIGYGVYVAVKAYGGSYIKIPVIGNIIYNKIFSGQ
jgi:uncharacterized Tic20 family protein